MNLQNEDYRKVAADPVHYPRLGDGNLVVLTPLKLVSRH